MTTDINIHPEEIPTFEIRDLLKLNTKYITIKTPDEAVTIFLSPSDLENFKDNIRKAIND